MDWRKAFTILALVAGVLPTGEELQAYVTKLRAQKKVADHGLVTKDIFTKVSSLVVIHQVCMLARSLLGSTNMKPRCRR